MKAPLTKIAQVSLLIATLSLFAGCKKEVSIAPTGNSASTSSSGGIVSAEKTSFDAVTSKLDKGGNLYVYLSTEQVIAKLSTNFAAMSNVFTQLPMPGAQPDIAQKVFGVLGNLTKLSGVQHISGFGASSIAREPNFYYSKVIVHHYAGDNDGLIWSVFGKESHPLKELDLLPEDTAFAIYTDLDVPLTWKTIENELKQIHNPQVDSALAEFPQKFKAVTDLDLDEVLNSLGGGYGVVFTLDQKTTVTLPLPNNPIEMPEPGLAIFAKVKNDTIYNRIDQLAANNPLVSKSEDGGVKSISIALPMPMPLRLQPTIARSGDYLFITSSDKILHDMLDVQSGKEKGFKSTEEFKRLSQGVPKEGNNFTLITDAFGKSMKAIASGAMKSQAATLGEKAKSFQDMMDANPTALTYAVSANGPEGWESFGNGSQPMSAVILPASVVAGVALGAAIALPAVAKAKAAAAGSRTQNSPGASVCLSNLRIIDGAKGQWALENHKMNSDTPTKEDLLPYLGRPNAPFPSCPQGGIYTIGSIGERPSCSIPGHELP